MSVHLKAYVDGSFNQISGTYGYGLVILVNGKAFSHKGSGNDPGMVGMRNVAGEILGALTAVEIAKRVPGVTDLTIFYDYEGIEKWVSGKWRAKNQYTQAYKIAMEAPFPIYFRKVAAHTGDYYNEMADKLAKEGAGI